MRSEREGNGDGGGVGGWGGRKHTKAEVMTTGEVGEGREDVVVVGPGGRVGGGGVQGNGGWSC